MRYFRVSMGITSLLAFFMAQCATATPAIRTDTYDAHAAYVLHNGRTSATVVPALGRVMQFERSDKSTFNWLWNNASPHPDQPWKNWGGHKTWLVPQQNWQQWLGAGWPPDAAWTKVLKTDILPNGVLQTSSALSASGIRLLHHYEFDANGDFVIRQTAEKLRGKPVQMALWSVTQIAPPEGIFFVPYHSNATRSITSILQGKGVPKIDQRGALACYYPSTTQSLKIGIHTATPLLAVYSRGQLFVLRAAPQTATYPDATPEHPAGFSTEIFDTGPTPNPYIELEMLSPLRQAWLGSRWTFSVRWHIYSLQSQSINAPELWDEVAQIINAP